MSNAVEKYLPEDRHIYLLMNIRRLAKHPTATLVRPSVGPPDSKMPWPPMRYFIVQIRISVLSWPSPGVTGLNEFEFLPNHLQPEQGQQAFPNQAMQWFHQGPVFNISREALLGASLLSPALPSMLLPTVWVGASFNLTARTSSVGTGKRPAKLEPWSVVNPERTTAVRKLLAELKQVAKTQG